MNLLTGLNEPQREAVTQETGPLLIFAGAGSGKTRTLTHRIAYLVTEKNVPPARILAVTFTNKAAREMRERLEALLGPSAKRMWLGTFHALCAKMLRIHGSHIEIDPHFAIFDADDQLKLVKEVLKEANLDSQRFPPARVLGKISDAKNKLQTPADLISLAGRPHEKVYGDLYRRYQERLRAASALDFDDLLTESVRLLRESPESLEHWRERFLHVLIDEFQDVNEAQFRWAQMLASKHRNICVVGDDDQCVAPGTLLQTPKGEIAVEKLVKGKSVMGAAGRGLATSSGIESIRKNHYRGPLLRVQTVGGRELRLTPGHICFARLGVRSDVHYVYLMFRGDKGYRVGMAVGARSDGRRAELQNGLRVRCNQAAADKMWVLRVCSSRAEALYWEQFFAFQYGIPTTVFFAAGRAMQFSQAQIDALYAAIDTRGRAARLMEEWNLSVEHPHYRPSGLSARGLGARRLVHLTAFGGSAPSLQSPWCRHRIWLNTSDRVLEAQVLKSGFETRPGNRQTWRVERQYSDLDRTALLAQNLAHSAGDLEIARWAALSDGLKFAFQPAAHLRPTMQIPVWQDGKIGEDEILSITEEPYDGPVYDLDVADLRNYVAGGIVVHNSIYAWRGANVQIILDFEKQYPDAKTIRLEQNYRSTQNILDAAHGVIANNFGRADKKLWTQEAGGAKITVHGALNADEEARWIARRVETLQRDGFSLNDFAILCRINAQSRVFEDTFRYMRVPLRLVGTQRFYDRREIRDLMAFLKFVYNPNDGIATLRLINIPPRGIGAATISKLQELAAQAERSLGALLLDPHARNFLSPAVARKIEPLQRVLILLRKDARESPTLADLVERILERTQFLDWLRLGKESDSIDREANINEFINAVENFDLRLAEEINDDGETEEIWDENDPLRLGQFLGKTALEGGGDKDAEAEEAVTLMTLHSAKGLEFPIVFLAGMEQGLLPHARAVFSEGASPEELEEERRLLYVGLTRARQQAILTFAAQRTLHGRTETTEPSQFLAEIPQNLLLREGIAAGGSRLVQSRSSAWDSLPPRGLPTFSPASSANGAARDAKPTEFKVGDKITHATYGEGLVVAASQNGGPGEWVEVTFFGGAGKKKMIVAYANLKKA